MWGLRGLQLCPGQQGHPACLCTREACLAGTCPHLVISAESQMLYHCRPGWPSWGWLLRGVVASLPLTPARPPGWLIGGTVPQLSTPASHGIDLWASPL